MNIYYFELKVEYVDLLLQEPLYELSLRRQRDRQVRSAYCSVFCKHSWMSVEAFVFEKYYLLGQVFSAKLHFMVWLFLLSQSDSLLRLHVGLLLELFQEQSRLSLETDWLSLDQVSDLDWSISQLRDQLWLELSVKLDLVLVNIHQSLVSLKVQVVLLAFS